MTVEEKDALLTIQNDVFQARKELMFERRCINRALDVLKEAVDIVTGNEDDHYMKTRLVRIIDAATKELQREMEK